MRLFKQSLLMVIFLVFFASQAHAVNTLNLGNFSKAPKFLSEFGFFQDMQKQIPSEGVHPYSLVNPLFSDQTDKLRFVCVPEGEKLAKKLCKKTFADYVMFQNSGAEATEAAIKVARRYFYSIGKPNKNRILCIKNSFHGRTLAAIFASGSKKMTEGFGPKVTGFDHFNFGDHKSLKKKINKNTITTSGS